MAARKALIRDPATGRVTELPNGDTLDGAGGGSAVFLSTTITVAPAQYGSATVTVVDAAATPATLVMAVLTPNADHDADDLEDVAVTAEAGAGVINFSIASIGAVVGDYKIIYQKG